MVNPKILNGIFDDDWVLNKIRRHQELWLLTSLQHMAAQKDIKSTFVQQIGAEKFVDMSF